MCGSNVFQSLGKLDIGSKLREKISVNDPGMKYLGYAGVNSPANAIKARLEGGQTAVSKKAEKMGASRDAKRFANSRVTGVPGHITSIAAHKARGGQ